MTAWLLVVMLNGTPTVIQTAPTYDACIKAGDAWLANNVYFNPGLVRAWTALTYSCE